MRFFDEDGPLARRVEGFVPRSLQTDMALLVAQTLDEPGGRAVIEAGTGTGKSFAYLVPALLSDKKVVIATGTKALQDQLFDKDLPVVLDALTAATGQKKTAALMKGRANYLCKLRFEGFAARPLFAFQSEAEHFDDIVAWAESTPTGDRAELSHLPDTFQTWSDLDAGSDTCIGQKCALYEDCFVTKMRKRAEAADIVVVNHHLLCADARIRLEGVPRTGQGGPDEDSMPFAQVIPAADAVIIDEAHALPDVATKYFGVSVTGGRLGRLATDLSRWQPPGAKSQHSKLLGLSAQLKAQAEVLGEHLLPHLGRGDRARIAADGDLEDIDLSRERLVSTLDGIVLAAEEVLSTFADKNASYADGLGIVRRAEDLTEELRFVLDKGIRDPRFVAFCEDGLRGYSVGAAPIDVAAALHEALWKDGRPVILTSATLASGGDTAPFEHRVGLDLDEEAPRVGVVFESPFAYREQAGLYAPTGMPEPSAADFTPRLHDEIEWLVALFGGGALLLFTSHRALRQAHEALAPGMVAAGRLVLKQGDAPKHLLLARFRDDEDAVLFATQSFWEGVDVRGAALRLVVIDKLPFRSPTDPVGAARAELEKQKGHDPFKTLSLPEATVALKQGVGRLVRTEADRGVVAVLDGRLRKKRYGKLFLDSLPDMVRLGSRKTVEQFFERVVRRDDEEEA